MFNWLRRNKKTEPPAFQKYFILLPGNHSLDLLDIKGISLKEVNSQVWEIHKGIKYCIYSPTFSDFKQSYIWKALQEQVAIDIKKLLFDRELVPENVRKIKHNTTTICMSDERS